MANISTKVGDETAERFRALCIEQGDTPSAMLRDWIEAAVGGGVRTIVAADDELAGWVLLTPDLGLPDRRVAGR